MQKKQPFGFQTQGDNYDNYRPSYPQVIIDKILNGVSNKQKYLDVATGTGQLLFRIAPYFKQSIGTDISENMIKSASNKINGKQNIKLIKTDCLDPLNQYVKFDLVTVGQAIHWFPIPDFINFTAEKLITENGKFVVIGYFRKGIFSCNENQLGDVYRQFMTVIEQCSKFDQKDLHEEYPEPKYNFKERFKQVEKEVIDYKIKMTVESLVKYLKTYSFYNIYRENFSDRSDPIEIVESQLKDQKQVILETRYFIYTCSGVL